jgi:hypothetical protein
MDDDQEQVALSASTKLSFTTEWTAERTTEQAVILSDRVWRRTITKLEGCKERGLAELWIAVGGISAGGAASAIIGLATLPAPTVRVEKDNLQIITIFCIIITLLCALGYFTTREKNNKAIEMVIGDMKASQPDQEDAQ